ncbi:predicted protein [Uncinocarpus reesii 1704]|uniref:Chromatin assembly factor 1 subunit A n=1 Tax=Uncinocarpus reesii (strain UAMH 1704) TaxID=336963 RepID=C4JLZ9_UNCRE|nr:uncharacterized protein UREG_03857 [Uncinocarpus reesii 1704]EEP79011.1 predicted protein [Uncinocarpus reesii 1704]
MGAEVQHGIPVQAHPIRPATPKKRPYDDSNRNQVSPQANLRETNTEWTTPRKANPQLNRRLFLLGLCPPSRPLQRIPNLAPFPVHRPSQLLFQTQITCRTSQQLPIQLVPLPKGEGCRPLVKKQRPRKKQGKTRLANFWEEEKQKREEEKKRREEEREAEKRRREEVRKKKEEEKEEEKRKREEEKKKKDEEKEAERKKREEKRKQKEDERIAREEEKKKKERSQMRLNAFFTKPSIPNSTNKAVEPKAVEESNQASASQSPDTKAVSDYSDEFPPFFVQSHVCLGASHRFQRDAEALLHVREKIDTSLKDKEGSAGPNLPIRPSELFNIMPYKRRYGKTGIPPVRELVMALNDADASKGHVIDLTGEKVATNRIHTQNILRKIPMKLLQFREDVRPPYQGTFTKHLPSGTAIKLCRNPFSRVISDVNYDYDSEAEWEEPEEGEDLNSEGEEDASEDDEEDMDDFLDDGDDEIGKRKMIVGDLEPVCTGICWTDGNKPHGLLGTYQMEILSETFNFPIDPFSDAYWKKPGAALPTNPSISAPVNGKVSDPSQRTLIPSTNGFLAPGPTSRVTPAPTSTISPHLNSAIVSQKPKAQFPSELLPDFKQAVSGSDLTKAGLIEVLKKRFPKVSKEVIKDTLTATAVRPGQKEADKCRG